MRFHKSIFKNIPEELKARDRGVLWKAELREGEEKPTKVPYSPHGGKAKANDPLTWGTFAQCYTLYSQDSEVYGGIGFVFSSDDDIAGMDIDLCRVSATGQIEPWAWKIITALDSYTEVSNSGTGVHIIFKGKIPGSLRRKGHIEVYESGRFFVMTGNHLEGTPQTVEHRQDALNARYGQRVWC